MKLQFDINKTNLLKDILLRLNNGDSVDLIQKDIEEHFKDVDDIDFLLTMQELFASEEMITSEDVNKLLSMRSASSNNQADKVIGPGMDHPGHPANIFKKEIDTFQSTIKQMNDLMVNLEKADQTNYETEVVEELKRLSFRLGELHKHFHRKEKLFFPIMERYGHYNPIRITWRADDIIRALYQGIKRQISQLPDIEFSHVQITYDRFEKEFRDMLFQEEAFILPVLKSLFNGEDWLRIAKESDAFGYVSAEEQEEWEVAAYCAAFIAEVEGDVEFETEADEMFTSKNFSFGGGFLTPEEANLIFNHLPLEITFVDKNMVFKYFNKMTEAENMMLVRTPISIGRNVANCHPPKSLSKVMRLMRDLRSRKRESETMWFKKGEEYIHITYKGLFNDDGEYLGILEYVQDIQPFLNLPTEVKRALSEMSE